MYTPTCDFGHKQTMRCVAQVEAEAITDNRPRAGFTPRRGKGFPLLGKSETYPPAAKVRRCSLIRAAARLPLKPQEKPRACHPSRRKE